MTIGLTRVLALLLVLTFSCGCADSPSSPSGPTGSGESLAGFALTGDPSSASGATWTYRATTGGTAYDLQGILYKPAGSGPFPAIVLSHGVGGNVNTYARPLATRMVGWGAVVIATNYTHAGGVPIGAPGGADEQGASTANVARGRKLLELLRSLGYVDMTRIAAHGHSSGAFVTTALIGAEPQAFRGASHTAGGIRPAFAAEIAPMLPSEAQASTIRTPYQLHHGDNDVVVPLVVDQLLASVLTSHGVTHELVVYPGTGHNNIEAAEAVLDRIRSWYVTHGVLRP